MSISCNSETLCIVAIVWNTSHKGDRPAELRIEMCMTRSKFAVFNSAGNAT
jgi:hypothetical protein